MNALYSCFVSHAASYSRKFIRIFAYVHIAKKDEIINVPSRLTNNEGDVHGADNGKRDEPSRVIIGSITA
jgi:hypothetical protein